jgi:DnaK suppressor protein
MINEIIRKGSAMGLTSEDLAELQMALLLKRSEILLSVTGLEESLRPEEIADTGASPFDRSNVGTADYDLGNTAFLLENERKIVAEIDHCLRAMSNGFYGTCVDCGDQIPTERLKAIPWTRWCVACAAEAERPRARYRRRPRGHHRQVGD